MALPVSDSETIDTLVSSTLNTYSGDPVNFVNEGGEKMLKKIAAAGRIFAVNDSRRVEHPVMFGTDGENWTRYIADEYDGEPATNNLAASQNEVLTKARFSLKDVTKNLNIPQTIIGRPSVLAKTEVQWLVKRAMMEIFQEEEMWFLLGVETTGGTEALATPFLGDTSYAAIEGSMSASALLTTGNIDNAHIFAGITGNDSAQWIPQGFAASSATASSLDGFIGDIQNAVLRTGRFGGLEKPTHGLSTIDWYNKLVEALRDKTVINDGVVRNLGVSEEIPFAGMMWDYSAHLVKDELWDSNGVTQPEIPVMLLNLNSLRLNLVYGGDVGEGGGFVKKKSPLAVHPLKTNFFTRLHYRYCWSLDNGRRSMSRIHGWTFGA